MDDRTAIEHLRTLVTDNSSARNLFICALRNAEIEIKFDDLVNVVDQAPRPKTCTCNSENAIGNLLKDGGVVQSIYVNGEPYKGTEEDLKKDETLPEDAEVIYTEKITEAGKQLLSEIAPETMLGKLLEEQPDYVDLYLSILRLCATDSGVPKSAIEKLILDNDIYARAYSPSGEKVLPVYFWSQLENACGIIWRGTWKTTEEGRSFAQNLRK